MLVAWVSLACLQNAPVAGVQEASPPTALFPGLALTEDRIGLVEILVEPALLEPLFEVDRVVLEGFPWDGGLALELERVPSPLLPDALHVDGRATPSDNAALASYWSGRVAGDPDSDVFLALLPNASQGWVRRGDGDTVHLMSGPAPDRGRGAYKTVLVEERVLEKADRRFRGVCATASLAPPPGANPLAAPTLPRPSQGFLAARYRGRIAVETDWQFFQIFGNLQAAEAYATALIAAANVRFVNQFNADVRVDYLGLYTTPADPWMTQDQPGAICLDTLYEFQAAWSFGGAPVPAELHLFLSGVDLGCGAAFIGGLCTPDRSFSLMSRMDGLTPFPVAPGPLNWDFVFTCHELGHNLGSVHTHEYCPPLDQCPPPAYFGPCQTAQVCTNQAGLMSYCHGCPGGISNFTTWYHPIVAAVLRAHVVSCFFPH